MWDVVSNITKLKFINIYTYDEFSNSVISNKIKVGSDDKFVDDFLVI